LDASIDSEEDTNPIPNCDGIDRDGWSGKALLARHADGSDFVEVIIISSNPNACVDGRNKLGMDDVGIVVLEVYSGDPDLGDLCLRLPMRQVFYNEENRYVNIYDHEHKWQAIDIQLQGNRQRKGVWQYRYDRRT